MNEKKNHKRRNEHNDCKRSMRTVTIGRVTTGAATPSDGEFPHQFAYAAGEQFLAREG